jgi:hypothetical protein
MLIDFNSIDKQRELFKAANHEIKAARYINENVAEEMGFQLGDLRMGEDLHFATDSRWSLHDLIVYCLKQSGPADLYFCTYAIKEFQARLFANMQRDGLIRDIVALLDYRVGTFDPGADQLIKATAKQLGYMRTHAKLIVLQNEVWGITIAGSANLTSNTRADIGVITCDRKISEHRIQWILKNITDAADQRTT